MTFLNGGGRGGISVGSFFGLITSAVALVLTIIHMQSFGHGGNLGAAYRNEAAIDAMQAQLTDIRAQLEDNRRRIRFLAGEELGDLPMIRLPGTPPIPRGPRGPGAGGARN